MEKFIDKDTLVIIVAIENYRFEKISKVKYALNDANAFKELLISELNIDHQNIKIYTDSYASKTALEDEIKYTIMNLNSEEKFVFYYVGHGFFNNGINKLTAWDTSDTNIFETTISLKDILINPLQESQCKRSLLFLDACSTQISESILSREAISNINAIDTTYLINQNEYSAAYFSCSPGEKSYSDDNLQHGIWTFHLIEALKGLKKEILRDEKYITDISLRDYLRKSVPLFISEKTDIKASQTPFANLKTSHSFIIHEVTQKVINTNHEFPLIDFNDNTLKLLHIEIKNVKSAKGFKKSHWVPDKINSTSEDFIKKVYQQDISDDLQEVYQKIKEILSFRRKDISKEIDEEGGTLKTSSFEYSLLVEQHEKNPGYAKFKRTLTIKNSNVISSNFDDIFSVKPNIIILEYKKLHENFESLVEKFENLSEIENGKIIDDDRKLTIEYTSIDGIVILLQFSKQRVIIEIKRNYRIRELLDKVEQLINKISIREFHFMNIQ